MTLQSSLQPSFGLVNGRPLFLDLASDEYFLLEPAAEANLIAALANGDGSSDAMRTAGDLPTREIGRGATSSDAYAPLASIQVWRIARKVRRALRTSSLAEVIASTRLRPGSSKAAAISAEALSRRFLKARRWRLSPPNCLADSLALRAWLAWHDVSAELVFGAKLDPFAAHCWLQKDGVLLNDTMDRIETFTPVAVVT